MAKKKRLTVSLKRDEAMRVTRVSVGDEKVVYVLLADKKMRYTKGKSRIVYIGTTSKGVIRIARSAAVRAEDILRLRGVREFHARVVTCKPRQKVKTWQKLEQALLITFRELYGETPICNTHWKRKKATDHFDYFRKRRLENVLEELS